MKRAAWLVIASVVGCAAAPRATTTPATLPRAGAPANATTDAEAWRNLRPKEPPQQLIPPPPVRTFTLPNGLVVHLVENHRLPLVRTMMIVHGGAAHRQPGVARLVVTSIARGSRTSTPAAFAERLGTLGGEVHADVSPDYTQLSIDALAEQWQETLRVIGDAVMHPDFRAPYVQTLIAELTAQIEARRHGDGGIALDTAQHAIYGDHPYGWTPSTSPQEFTKLTARDAQAFYDDCWRPANIELIVVGDVDSKRAGGVLSEVLGRWRGRAGVAAAVAPPPPPPPSQVIVIDRPAAKQVTLVSATRLGPRSAPAWYAAIVANRLLGGAFDSRLNTTLRAQKSYVYAIRSSLVATAAGGFMYAATSTKTENVGATAREIFDQLDGLRSRPPAARELEIARSSTRLVSALDLETNADVANALAGIVGLRLPSGELAASFEKLDAVTGEDVQGVATEQMTPQRTSMVIVGPAGALLPQLRAQGLSPVVAGAGGQNPE